jgi:anti-sigma-K factor RskA
MPLGDPDPELAHPEAAGWVLGILDAGDADRFAAHLPSCPDCRAAVAELGPAARLLPTAAPDAAPPPALQAATLARVAQAAAAAREGGKRSRWRSWNVRMLALAAVVVLVAGLGAGLLLSRSSSGETYTVSLRPGPGLAASGQAVVRQTSSGWSIQLTVAHFADLRPGQFYECWWLSPGNGPGHPPPISAGTFTVGPSGTATLPRSSAADPDTFTTMQITLQTPASAGQPGKLILVGTASD